MGIEKPRIALLGAGPPEVELLVELHACATVEIVAVYEPDVQAPGLGLAEVLGIAAGHDDAARERLRSAEFVVLPRDRAAYRPAIEWASGLRADLVSLADARRRWGGDAPRGGPIASAEAARRVDAAAEIHRRDRADLADWLLDIALRAIGANGGSIQILSHETSELYLLAARGLSERLMRLGRRRVGDGIAGRVAETGEPSILHGPRPGHASSERGTISASISLPLEDIAGLLGVLNVSSTQKGKRFGDPHLRALQELAPRITGLLRQADHAPEMQTLGSLAAGIPIGDPRKAFPVLLDRLREALSAERLHLHLTTEEGDWVEACDSGSASPAKPRVETTTLSEVLLESRWKHLGLDSEDPDRGRTSRLLAPLCGVRPLGVLQLEFDSLPSARDCERRFSGLVQQLAFEIEARLRELRDADRVAQWQRLAHMVPKLLQPEERPDLEAWLVAEAVHLVRGRSAFLRRVDEAQHSYTRPTVYGIADAALEAWRRLDARVSERTLHLRRSDVTTVVHSESNPSLPKRSLITVPAFHVERIVAVLNVYDKVSSGFLDPAVFTPADREALEVLALVAAPFLAEVAAKPSAGSPASSRPAAPTEARGVDEPGTARATTPPVDGSTPTPRPLDLLEVLQREVARASRYHHGLGVAVLRFTGLAKIPAALQHETREALAACVRGSLRSSDVLAWRGPEELVLVLPETHARSRALEERLLQKLEPVLQQMGEGRGLDLVPRIGSSLFPRDGEVAQALVEAAQARAS